MMTEQVAYEHREDLRREAAAFRSVPRAASRKALAVPRLASRVAVSLHLRAGVVGCQA